MDRPLTQRADASHEMEESENKGGGRGRGKGEERSAVVRFCR